MRSIEEGSNSRTAASLERQLTAIQTTYTTMEMRCRRTITRYCLPLLLALQTGCASYFMTNGMKVPQVEVPRSQLVPKPNAYQHDFLYLKAAAEQAVPLEDNYFPPEKRSAMEKEIMARLARSNCTYETFLFSLHRYLGELNNEHARVHYNPKPVRFAGVYPFSVHYYSNALYLSDIATNYDKALIGQRITQINGRPVSEVEQKLFTLTSCENVWTKRKALEPDEFSHPGVYRILGLSSSETNNLELCFADHETVSIAPIFKGRVRGYDSGRWKRNPITRESKHLYDYKILPDRNFAYLQFNACFDKAAIYEGIPVYVKSWLRPFVRAYLFVEFHRKNPKGIAHAYDPAHPYFRDFLAEAIGKINVAGITNLIIDLRYNGGGQEELCTQLLYHLTDRTNLQSIQEFYYNPKLLAVSEPDTYKELRAWYVKKFGQEPTMNTLLPSPQQELPFFEAVTDRKSAYYVPPTRPVFKGRVIVLANENTDSGAALLVSAIQDNHLGTVIGTTTGNNPIGPSGFTPFKLPRTGVIVSLPTSYYRRAEPNNGEVFQPDIWVENSVEDVRSGRDAAFEKALELMNTPR